MEKKKTETVERDTDRVVFLGRTMGEYLKFFDFTIDDLKGRKVLDCPGGASSFTAEASKKGIGAVAMDVLYGNETDTLFTIGEKDLKHAVERVAKAPHLYNWKYYHYLEMVEEYRALALRRFIEDYPRGLAEGRYVKADFPELPFDSNSFDIVLSSHLLFLYAVRFDYDFHLNSILELARVASCEARIYPIIGHDTKPCPFMDKLLADLEKNDVVGEITEAPFEFLKGSNRMLRVRKGSVTPND